jgi:IPT/TIG domain
MFTFRLAAVSLVCALASGAAAAIVSATERRLCAGSTFEVTGSGFGRSPTAWLEVAGRRIPVALRRGGTDSTLSAKLRSFPRGTHGSAVLRVLPRGERMAFTFAGMSIELPDADGLSPASGGARSEVTIDGSYFGAKTGRVAFGGRYGKVTSWSDGQITVLVPAGAEPGPVFVDVSNRVGASLTRLSFTITE